MSFRSALAVFLLGASVSLGAELRTLTGTQVSGDLVSINDQEVVIKTDAGPVTTPLAQVLELTLQPPPGQPPRDAKYTDVQLTDGTLLHCNDFTIKGKEVTLTLLSGQQVKLPLDTVSYILREAHDEQIRKEWQEKFLGAKRNSDMLSVKRNDRLNPLPGTFGAADDEGRTIQFDRNSAGNPRPVKLDALHGLLFLRQATAVLPPAVCKLQDVHQNVVSVASVTQGPAGFTITTPAGAKIEYPRELVARLDFSKGKLTFLASLEPARVVETSTEERVEHYRRNENLDGGKIRLRLPDPQSPNGFVLKSFDNGLALHSHTELEYDLKGEYDEFRAVVGVDESVGGLGGETVLKIEADGRELFNAAFQRQDEAKEIALDIKDVNRLRIIVTSGDLLDLGKHLNLAEARVSKR